MAAELKNIDEIIKAVEQNTCGKILDLAGKKLGDVKVAKLAKALGQNTCLRVLNLTNNSIKTSTRELGQALKTNRVLHTLILDSINRDDAKKYGSNQIGSEEIKSLCEGLTVNQSIRNFSIRGNKIDDKGAEFIAEVLKSNVVLYSINLRSCAISTEGTRAIANALQINKRLGVLDLTGNKIHEGMSALVHTLTVNTSLHTLKLRGCLSGSFKKGLSQLIQALTKDLRVSILDLSWNELFVRFGHFVEIEEGMKLLEVLTDNTSLSIIDIRDQCSLGVRSGIRLSTLEESCLKSNEIIYIISDLQLTGYSEAEHKKRKERTKELYKKKFIAAVNQLDLLSKNNKESILKFGKVEYLRKIDALYIEGAEYLSGLQYILESKEYAELQMKLEDSMTNGLRNLKYFETNKHLQFVTAIQPDFDIVGNFPAVVAKANQWLLFKGDAQAQFTMGVVYARGLMDIEEDHQRALIWFMKAADQSHPEAQYLVGLHYLTDKNDLKKAVEFLRKPSLVTHGNAQVVLKSITAFEDLLRIANSDQHANREQRALAKFKLGQMYEKGNPPVVTMDLKQAGEWYQQAIALDHQGAKLALELLEHQIKEPKVKQEISRLNLVAHETNGQPPDIHAQFSLGLRYHKGDGVEQDHKLACELFQKAANQGHSDAQYYLGVKFHTGEGVVKDLIRARELYQKSADQWNTEAILALAKLDEEEKPKTEFEVLLAKSLDSTDGKGDPDTQYNLGLQYAEGRGVTKDKRRACELYAQAAKQNHAVAQYELGVMYANGWGVAKDQKRACELYALAVAQNHAGAQYALAEMYANGRGVTKDKRRACELYAQAVAQNHEDAQFNLGLMYDVALYKLGLMYEYGRGVAKDVSRAWELYMQAAEQNYPNALRRIGKIYENGILVQKDLNKAKEYFQKAYENGKANVDKMALERVSKALEEARWYWQTRKKNQFKSRKLI